MQNDKCKILNDNGFALIEMLISVALLGIITSGLIFFLRANMSHEAVFRERSDIYKEADRVMNMIRADLSTASAVTDMEYFINLNDDAHFNRLRSSNSDNDDIQIPVDDPTTLTLREDANPPKNDSATDYFDESSLNYENSPYGITYDYVFGITNSGNMDAIYFRGSVVDGNGRVPANICYRLVKKRLQTLGGTLLIEEDTGGDSKADETETGFKPFHPVANPDPNSDNFDPIFNGTATEGNGLLDKNEPDQNGNTLIDRAHTFELQRIITTLVDESGDKNIDDLFEKGTPRPMTRLEILSKSVISFNIFYYDKQKRQYVEPEATIKRFSYPPDVGAVGRFGTETPPNQLFSFGGMTTEYFINGNSSVSNGDYIFLMGTGTPLVGTIPPFNNYKIIDVNEAAKKIKFDLSGISLSIGTDTPVQFIPAGIFDSSGVLSCRSVKDGFTNLKPGDNVFAQQWSRGTTSSFAIKPGLYTIMDKRGDGLIMDLEDQSPVSGTSTLFFRAAYLPPAVKINLTWHADQLSINRGEPFYITFSNTIALP